MAKDARVTHIIRVSLTPKAAGDVAQSIEVLTDSKEQPKLVIPVTAKAK